MKEYYEILGLNPGASQEQIDEAYNKLPAELNPKNNNNIVENNLIVMKIDE